MQKITLAFISSLYISSSLFGATLSPDVKNNSLIVYNSNIGLVHEERNLEIKSSDTTIVYKDVAMSINTDSVNVSLPNAITINSQQYRYDKLTLSKLLEAHIGKKVEVRLLRNRNEFKIISGTLLSYTNNTAILRTINYKIISVKTSGIQFSAIPDTLITKPSLVWNVKVKEDTQTQMKLDYLISNINFKSDYILNVDTNSSTLSGWITINNRSGKSFNETELSLLAGDINRAHNNQPHLYKSARMSEGVRVVKEQSFEGYHFYTIPFKVTLANNEKTQIKFLDKNNLSVKRAYSAQMGNPLYLRGEREVSVSQAFLLDGLDMPLPSGTIRVYSQLDKKTILLGENSIKHTASNTPLNLKVGKNFDLKVKESVILRNDTKSNFNVDVLYSIKNSSEDNKTVNIVVPFNRQESSKITTDMKYNFTKANLVNFSLEVPASSSKKFKVKYESKK